MKRHREDPHLPTVRCVLAAALIVTLSAGEGRAGGGLTGGATEWTQILNNGELVHLVGLQNTAQLPAHVWGQVQSDLNQLRSIVNQGQGIAFSMGNADDVLKQRFQSYADFKTSLPSGTSFSSSYQNWSATNRDTISGTLKAAHLTADQFGSEEATMSQLRSMSESADGQMKALQVGHDIAAQQVAQMQKLRGLVSQQMTMMATWYQSEQAEKDLSQARREDFFKSTAPSVSGGQEMRPRW